MPRFRTLWPLAIACSAALFDATLRSQDVILSEVGEDATGTWIELFNRDTIPADVSTWSLYLTTATPNQPRTYWWGFRPGTTIAPGEFLLVRWLTPPPNPPRADEVATGTSQYGFLFGLGAEPLPTDRGALALLRSQLSAQMNSPSIIADWVAWGSGGLTREGLAEQAGVWRLGMATAPRSTGASLARHPSASVAGHPELSWFVDPTPTPGSSNVGAAALATIGTACAPNGHHLLGAPVLTAASMPVLGNSAFAVNVSNTTGVLLEHSVLVFALEPAAAGLPQLLPPVAGVGCSVFLDPSTWFANTWMHTTVNQTTFPLSLTNLPATLDGIHFAMQALVFDDLATAWPAYQGVTNAVVVTLGS